MQGATSSTNLDYKPKSIVPESRCLSPCCIQVRAWQEVGYFCLFIALALKSGPNVWEVAGKCHLEEELLEDYGWSLGRNVDWCIINGTLGDIIFSFSLYSPQAESSFKWQALGFVSSCVVSKPKWDERKIKCQFRIVIPLAPPWPPQFPWGNLWFVLYLTLFLFKWNFAELYFP